MKRTKKAAVLTMTTALVLGASCTAYAGQWQQNETGRWWWQNDDGSRAVDEWRWLDGNDDGIYEQYHFNADGYLDVNTTIKDVFSVNADGARLEDYVNEDGTVATRVAILRNGPSADKQTRFFFINSEPTRIVDNSQFMGEYSDLKDGVCYVYEYQGALAALEASILDLEYMGIGLDMQQWSQQIEKTEKYSETNLYADESSDSLIGKICVYEDAENGYSCVRVFGYY